MKETPINKILIMTATVTPPSDAPGMNRMDPVVRMGDYKEALGHYIKMVGGVIDAIVFVENSSADLSPLRVLARAAGRQDRVEFITFDGMDRPSNYGRCYGEARILDRAMEKSEIIASAGEDAVCYKITGRYKLLNFPTLIRSQPRSFDLYCDMRKSDVPWADMRFMAWTKPGYNKILSGIAEEIREDLNHFRPGEESLYAALQRRSGRGAIVSSFRREPLIDGVRGFDNANWSQGKRKLVYRFRDLQRLLLRRVIV